VNKSEIINELTQESGLNYNVAEFVVNEVFAAIAEALVDGDGAELRGFGSFVVREYRPYTGRNPKSGEKIPVGPKKLPFFKVGKELRERVINNWEKAG
jgi:integration host factor subunit beta